MKSSAAAGQFLPGWLYGGQHMNDETWRDHYLRTARSAKLVKAIEDGVNIGLPAELFNPEDAVFHFCTDAFHLRDWIAAAIEPDQFPDERAFKRELNARINQLDEELFKKYIELAACRDIANGYKHLKLTGPSFLPAGEHSELVGRRFEVKFSEPQRIKHTYDVRIGDLRTTAGELAAVSMARWDVWFGSSSRIAEELREEVKARPWQGWPWEQPPWGLTHPI